MAIIGDIARVPANEERTGTEVRGTASGPAAADAATCLAGCDVDR